MTFWIYNFGQPIALAEPKLIPPDGPNAVSAAKSTRAILSKNKSTGSQSHSPDQVKQSSITHQVISGANYYQQSNQSPRHPVYRVDEVMTSSISTVSVDSSVREAWTQFGRHRFRHYPVVDEGNRLQGIISDRDIFYWIQSQPDDWRKIANETRITELMLPKVLTCAPHQNIRAVAVMMLKHHAGSILIMNEQQDILGIITRSDILRIIVKNEPLELWM